jgi:hypothetical protein
VKRGKWIPSEKIVAGLTVPAKTQEKHLAMLCVSVDQQVKLAVPNLQQWMTVYISKMKHPNQHIKHKINREYHQ